MSLCSLSDVLNEKLNPRTGLTKETKVQIRVGPVWAQTELDYKKHEFWGPFFEKFRDKIVTLQELLEYPHLDTPEWMITERNNKKILWHGEFGLINTKSGLHVPIYFECEFL